MRKTSLFIKSYIGKKIVLLSSSYNRGFYLVASTI
jgi:hypothetical protein